MTQAAVQIRCKSGADPVPFRVSYYASWGIEISGVLTSLDHADEFIRVIEVLKILLKSRAPGMTPKVVELALDDAAGD